MRTPLGLALALAAVVSPPAAATQQGMAVKAMANPIRKVVVLLQAMQKKVQEEGEKEAKLYEKFECYCKTGGGELEKSISAAETKGPEATADLEAGEGRLSQLKGDVKQAQVERTAAKEAMAKATAMRKKEAAAFAAEKSEAEANIEAVTKAVAAIEKGLGSSFLQTSAAQVLQEAVDKQEMPDTDRQELLSFLSGERGAGASPGTSEIVGIFKQMGDTMAKSLADATADEEKSIASYKESMDAKTKETKAITVSIETKTKQIGELGVDLVRLRETLSDTQEGLEEDKKFLAGLDKSCKTKKKEFEQRSKTRSEELVALADTIQLLNKDDALELFKKTLPSASASFLQLSVSATEMRGRARALLRAARKKAGRRHRAGLDFLVLGLVGKRALRQGGFTKVIAMCDNMIKELKKEQEDDDNKKEYCKMEFDVVEDKTKHLEQSIADQETEIAAMKDSIETLNEDIATLEAGIVKLDKSVAEATVQRKKENTEYKELMAADTAAKELLGVAKKRLNKFYNPKLYKDKFLQAPAPVEEAFLQVSAHASSRAPPAPPPETWDAYTKKSEENTGVVSMIDHLIRDLDLEMVEAEAEEKDAQSDYEMMMQDSGEKRTVDSKTLGQKQSAKADLESNLEATKLTKKDMQSELKATQKYSMSLHTECDFLMEYFDVRKTARTDEIDALSKARAVLSGADYSLLQVKSRHFLRRLP